jgi:hypothetical protein
MFLPTSYTSQTVSKLERARPSRCIEGGFDRRLAKPPGIEQLDRIFAEAPTRKRA